MRKQAKNVTKKTKQLKQYVKTTRKKYHTSKNYKEYMNYLRYYEQNIRIKSIKIPSKDIRRSSLIKTNKGYSGTLKVKSHIKYKIGDIVSFTINRQPCTCKIVEKNKNVLTLYSN